MQTFLPYPSFVQSAQSLDRQRLGKQRVEALQLLKGQWPNHPAAKMWVGYKDALALYGVIICREWMDRGYKDNCLIQILDEVPDIKFANVKFPDWFGNYDFHRSHQSNLVRKDASFYGTQFKSVPNDLPYVWPMSS